MKISTIFYCFITCYLCVLSCLSSCSPHTEDRNAHNLKGGKPGAPIELASPALVNIKPNEKSTVDIVLSTSVASGIVQILLTPTDNLQLLSAPQFDAVHIAKAQPLIIPVEVLANSNGRYYITLQLSFNDGEESSSRTLSVIVQVGEPAQEQAATLQKPSGNNIISLPAHETIKQP